MEETNEVLSFSLSVEEYALALSMINRPDLGRRILQSVSPTMTQEQMGARLTSASHSLAAHNLADISDKGTAVLNKSLEKSLLPIVKADKLFEVSQATSEGQTFYSIHTYHNQTFTSHRIRLGVIHSIDHGQHSMLIDYLLGKFSTFGENDTHRTIDNTHNLTLGLLGKIIKDNRKTMDPLDVLRNTGLDQDVAEQLVSDLLKQEMRGTIVVMDVKGDFPLKPASHKAQKTFLLLKGPEHSWMFEFARTNDEEIAQIQLMSKVGFLEKLREIVSNN